MDEAILLRRLVRARDAEERRALLEAYGPPGVAFFRWLKDRVRQLMEVDTQEALRVAEVGLETAAAVGSAEGMALAWWARGNALLFLGRHDESLTAYSNALSIFTALQRPEEVAQLQTNCMVPLMRTGRYTEAQEMGHRALEILEGRRETPQMANLLLNLGICALHRGDPATALTRIEQARGIFARLGNAVQAARCQVTQAVALERMDRFVEAQAALEEALQVFAAHEVRVPWARTALNLGVLHARLADHQTALRFDSPHERGGFYQWRGSFAAKQSRDQENDWLSAGHVWCLRPDERVGIS